MTIRGRSGRTLAGLGEIGLAALALVLLPAVLFRRPVTELDPLVIAALGSAALGYGAWRAWLLNEQWRQRPVGVLRAAAAAALAVVPLLLLILLALPRFQREVLVAVLALGGMLGLVAVLGGWRTWWIVVPAVAAATGIALQWWLATAGSLGAVTGQRVTKVIGSSLYELSVTTYRAYFDPVEAQQGGLAAFGDRYLLVNGDGTLYLFHRSADRSRLEVQRLAYRAPINREEFVAAGGPTIGRRTWFRVADVLAQPTGRGVRVFVSHHYWNSTGQCWVMRVSALEGTIEELRADRPTLAWSTVFESQPCMPLALEGEPVRFGGINNGGRMVLPGPESLLLSVGDHELDGYATPLRASQDPAASYGKVMLINLQDGSSRVFSLGHRNPQGLLATAAGDIWATEHGPQGGDELDLVRDGANYGWPLATHGTEYGTHAWPVAARPGSHDGFEQPFYSWVPSIGVSNLVEIPAGPFELWRGDLLVSSLRGRSFWRLRVREGRVVMAESIEFGQRIRDLQIGHDGELVVLTDGDAVHFITPSVGAETGEGLYRVCAGCHVAPAGSATAVGPSLQGVVGRKLAGDPGFEYSAALRAMTGSWTRERLDAFLADPATIVPGNTMMFSGIRDPATRRILVEYLADPASRLDQAPPVPD